VVQPFKDCEKLINVDLCWNKHSHRHTHILSAKSKSEFRVAYHTPALCMLLFKNLSHAF